MSSDLRRRSQSDGITSNDVSNMEDITGGGGGGGARIFNINNHRHNLRTVVKLDGSDKLNIFDTYNLRQVKYIPPKGRYVYVPVLLADLFVVSLLRLLAERQFKDPTKQQQLFSSMRRQLETLHILRPEDGSESAEMIIDQCCRTLNSMMADFQFFAEMPSQKNECVSMHSAREYYLDRVAGKYQLTSILKEWTAYSMFCAPRYRSEFEQIEQLGIGGYGRVYKVRSKMDKCEYAVKKIHLTLKDPKCFPNVQREVEVFARLKHTNIVEYVTSWLESSINSDDFDASQSNTCSSCASQESDSVVGERSSPRDECTNTESSCMNLDNNSVDNLTNTVAECQPFVRSRHSEEKPNDNSPTSFVWNQANDMLHPTTAASVAENGRSKKSKGFIATLYIQMELCSRTLTVWIETRNDLVLNFPDPFSVVNEEDSDSIFYQILKGVQYIHSKRLMHRDLNPNNIFINDKLCVKIGDFGLARHESVDDGPPSPLTPLPVKITSDVGTTLYSAPEQLAGPNYDQKADIYSLGMIQFELFYPFGTKMERSNVLRDLRHFNGFIEETTILKKRFPNQVKIIQSLLDRDPSKRPSASELDIRFRRRSGSLDSVTELNRTVTVLKEELKWKNDNNKKKDAEIKRLKRALKILNNKNMKLKRKLKSMAAKDPTAA